MDEIAPVIAAVGIFAIPITAILTAHQRKMAAIIHGRSEEAVRPTIGQDTQIIVQELRHLKNEVTSMRIELDNLKDIQNSSSNEASLLQGRIQ